MYGRRRSESFVNYRHYCDYYRGRDRFAAIHSAISQFDGIQIMPDMTIVIPHLRKSMNDAALQLNIARLFENTHHSFELVIDTESPRDPYKIWNDVAKIARGKIIVFSNSDVIMAKDWDVPFVKYMQDNAILTGYLVEPGNIGVADVNIHMDFGRNPYTFRPDEFENFAVLYGSNTPEVKEERGWYMPCAFLRDWFIWTNGFDTDRGGFPLPLDIWYWDKCRGNFGTKFIRVRSFSYHFQNLSSR